MYIFYNDITFQYFFPVKKILLGINYFISTVQYVQSGPQPDCIFKNKMNNVLNILFIMGLMQGLRSVEGLTFSLFDYYCRNLKDSQGQPTIFTGTSIIQCVEKCWLRPQCKSVIYKRLFPLCELYDVDVTTSEPVRLGTSCAVIKREDIMLDGTEV